MRPIDADAFKDYIRSGYEEMKHLFILKIMKVLEDILVVVKVRDY